MNPTTIIAPVAMISFLCHNISPLRITSRSTNALVCLQHQPSNIIIAFNSTTIRLIWTGIDLSETSKQNRMRPPPYVIIFIFPWFFIKQQYFSFFDEFVPFFPMFKLKGSSSRIVNKNELKTGKGQARWLVDVRSISSNNQKDQKSIEGKWSSAYQTSSSSQFSSR